VTRTAKLRHISEFENMKMRAGFASVFALCAVLGWSTSGAYGQTLTEAMAQAYAGNPTLRAARAGQRATDELVPQALSGWRPTVTASGEITHTEADVDPAGPVPEFDSDSTTGTLAITLNQPVFRGFKTLNGTKAAKATVAAGEQGLLATEQDVLFDAVRAYMGVIRGRSELGLRRSMVGVLGAQLDAARARFDAGDATRTDISQARARVAGAQAQVAAAQSNLASSEALFLKVIGREPGKLTYPRTPKLPGSLDGAMKIASEINPNVLAAALLEEASVHQIEVAKGDLLPTVSLQAQGVVTDDWEGTGAETESFSISGVVSVPLYDGGRTYSTVRQAKHQASEKRIQVIEANRAVREAVQVAWSSLAAAQQVSAANQALDGVKQENEAGTRTTLDVLNAQSEVFEARITQVNAEHDAVVGAFQLLAAMGQLTADHLNLPVAAYDAAENYQRVEKKWFGTDAEVVE
jgi:outer membrane protein